MCRPRLDLFHEIGQADGGMKAGENVQVVCHAVDAIEVASAFPDDTPDVTKEVFATIWRERVDSILRGKHNMVGDGGVG